MSSYLKYPGMSAETEALMRQQAISQASLQHQQNLFEAEKRAELKSADDVKNREVMRKILAENEVKAKAEEVRQRNEANKNLEEDLKRRFFETNPAATMMNWLNAKDEIMKDFFIERMNGQASREQIERLKYPKM